MKRPPIQSPRLSLSQLTSCHTKCSLGAAFFFALMVGCGVDPVISTTSSNGSANAPQAIAVSGVILQDMQLNVEVPLEVDAFESTELVSKLEGYVGEVLVDIGDDIADNEDFNVDLASLLHSFVGVLDGRTERVDCRT